MNTGLSVFLGTGFTFLMTVAGAALVFLFRGELNEKFQRLFLGFAAGVMIAASVWSLLIPAIEKAQSNGTVGWIPAAGGFLLGGCFLIGLERLLEHLKFGEGRSGEVSAGRKRNFLLTLAVTLHNIPEGMSVALAFALAGTEGSGQTMYASAIALAVGIGIQNFPEGTAIALPLRREGMSPLKAFVYASLSGIVEPIFGLLTVLLLGSLQPVMPWLLAFAAGAMIYVVVEELIPEAHLGKRSTIGTIGVMAGFLVMMILDVALG